MLLLLFFLLLFKSETKYEKLLNISNVECQWSTLYLSFQRVSSVRHTKQLRDRCIKYRKFKITPTYTSRDMVSFIVNVAEN